MAAHQALGPLAAFQSLLNSERKLFVKTQIQRFLRTETALAMVKFKDPRLARAVSGGS